MNRLLLVFAFALTGVSELRLAAEDSHTDVAQPNVLLIYSDDQGSFDLNCYGSTDLKTPNLDALHRGNVSRYACPDGKPARHQPCSRS